MNEPEPIRARWHELIDRHLLGEITDAESRELEAALAAHREARDEFRRRCNVDAALRHEATALAGETAAPASGISNERMSVAPHWFTWLAWRPLAAAAAGIVFGMFCTSVVMAYMAPSAGKVITLFSDGFEEGARKWAHGFPDQPEVWGGDAGEVVSSTGDVQPLDGLHMVRLDPSSTSTLSYLERIVDLQSLPVPQGNEVRQVAVTASFHAAERGLRDRYTLRVAAFAEAPGNVREQWAGREWREIEGALAMSKRALSTTTDAEGWQKLTTIVEVPREARSLVISLASGVFENPDRKTAHYIDDVQASLLIGSQPVETKTKRLNLTAK